ncbi:MAG TPA: thymidine kinase [Rectinemataceae bacterium]|nr:thymidine kinase [Rectinemataceae bacterium]
MNAGDTLNDTDNFLRNLGFPLVTVHHPFNHFDFTKPARLILVIGPMGSGKTEFSAKMWRDSLVARKKGGIARRETSTDGADRRDIFVVRSSLDASRFPDYPEDALAYRGGYERCGDRIGQARDSFALENLLAENHGLGTWIVDEAAFFDERVAYLMKDEARRRGLVFVCPTLVLNFRREIFNQTARLLLENATDVFPLTAYCEHHDCLADSLYTYRYYLVDGVECPALYFDPLIIIGGDRMKEDGREPNYCTRCDTHHYLPGKEYTYFTLKPLGEAAARGELKPLLAELGAVAGGGASRLASSLRTRHIECDEPCEEMLASLRVPCIAERALVYLYAEQNLLSADQLRSIARDLGLDREYLARRLADNRRPLEF